MTTAARASREIDNALPYFVDWLVENVHLVEITAYSDGDAYTIFESQLPFRAHAEFRKAHLDARQVLYQQLAERTWSPERLDEEASS
jgi:hypothetical protein